MTEQHKGKGKSRETDVFLVTAIKLRDTRRFFFLPLNQLAQLLFIFHQLRDVKVRTIIWIAATNMFPLSAHRPCSWNGLFMLDTFQFMSHPANTAACPLWAPTDLQAGNCTGNDWIR